jgi:hypothetical protein
VPRISLLRTTAVLTAATLTVAAAVVGLVGATGVSATAATPPGWRVVSGAPVDGQNSNILLGSTCSDAWSCWAVGMTFTDIGDGGRPTSLVEHWDGSSWTVSSTGDPAGDSLSGFFSVTCPTTTDCWAVGAQQSADAPAPTALAEHWNGSAWSPVATPATSGYLTSVACVDASDCWAAGTVVSDDNQSDPLHGMVDHWDGSAWTTVATPPSGQNRDQLNAVTCAGAADCWAVGFAGPDGLANNFLPNVEPQVAGASAFIEHWNGSSWSVVPAPVGTGPSGTYLDGVTCSSPTRCWAVGADMDAAGNPSSALIDTWDGTRWTTGASPDPQPSLLTGVTCVGPTDCRAAGVTEEAGNNSNNNQVSPHPLLVVGDGSSWSVDPSPDVTAYGYLNDLSCAGVSTCFAVGFAFTQPGASVVIQPLTEQLVLPPSADQGLVVSGSDGGVFALGDAGFHGSLGAVHLDAPIVGSAATPDGRGYWLVAADGGVFAFGDAQFAGSLGAIHLDAPIVGMAPTPDGRGYWLVAADGGVFTFGDADFDGSVPALGVVPAAPIVGVAPTPDGGGYWLVGRDGGIYAFGDADFVGSLSRLPMAAPVTGVAAT